jgi:hypothetical protein
VMTHPTRSRLTTDLTGNWRLYQLTPPSGMEMLGTVRRGDGSTGALARVALTGIYVQLNAQVTTPLDQRKVSETLAQKKTKEEL